MGMLDNIKDKAGDMMNNPDTKAKVEKIAKEKGISIEEAKKRITGQ